MLDDEELNRLRDRLGLRANELRAEIGAAQDERSGTPRNDPGSAVDDLVAEGQQLTEDTVRHAEQERDSTELRAVLAALARIEDGSYGTCLDCGAEIPPARVAAQPTASRCVICQGRAEQRERQFGGATQTSSGFMT